MIEQKTFEEVSNAIQCVVLTTQTRSDNVEEFQLSKNHADEIAEAVIEKLKALGYRKCKEGKIKSINGEVICESEECSLSQNCHLACNSVNGSKGCEFYLKVGDTILVPDEE